MNILHICSYYIGNKLYMNLIRQLSICGIDQEVFIPIKDTKYVGKNQLPSEFNTVKFYYKNILKRYDKFLFHNKIKKQMKEIEKLTLLNEDIDCIHAHTVFSDGGTAYNIHKKYGISYIINVRNTDINTFYKYGIHLRPFMYKVLINSKAIVFISHAYKKQMFSLLPSDILSKIESKCHVIPNGIDDYWHKKALVKKEKGISNEIKLVFCGLLDKNKNLGAVISACASLCNNGYNGFLNIIGSGPFEEEYKQLSKMLNIDEKVVFHGYINEKETISNIMDSCHILVMPSIKETFGLVYIEAMSRGLPVIYTRGQGIDGFFDEGSVGFSVEPLNVEMIVEAIKKIHMNYDEISEQCIIRSKDFNWDNISRKYRIIYK